MQLRRRIAAFVGMLRHDPGARTGAGVARELAYFGLTGWWSAEFTATARARMEGLFPSHGLPGGSRPAAAGQERRAFRNAADLLTALAGCLRNKREDRTLAMRVLAKAEERARADDDILMLHLVYQEIIRLHIRWRDCFPGSLDLIFGACHKQIAIAPAAAETLRARDPQQTLPIHTGFQVMAVLLENQGLYARAIEVCKEARFQGWSGNWTWRIGCLAKKLSEQGDPVQNMSRSGLGRI